MADYKIDEYSKCNKCDKLGLRELQGRYYVLKLNCKCGGRFVTDWNAILKGGKKIG